jgi:hypothetical protein
VTENVDVPTRDVPTLGTGKGVVVMLISSRFCRDNTTIFLILQLVGIAGPSSDTEYIKTQTSQ